MVYEESADYFLVCLRKDGIIGLVFGGPSLDLVGKHIMSTIPDLGAT